MYGDGRDSMAIDYAGPGTVSFVQFTSDRVLAGGAAAWDRAAQAMFDTSVGQLGTGCSLAGRVPRVDGWNIDRLGASVLSTVGSTFYDNPTGERALGMVLSRIPESTGVSDLRMISLFATYVYRSEDGDARTATPIARVIWASVTTADRDGNLTRNHIPLSIEVSTPENPVVLSRVHAELLDAMPADTRALDGTPPTSDAPLCRESE